MARVVKPWTYILAYLVVTLTSQVHARSDAQAVNDTTAAAQFWPTSVPIGIHINDDDPDFPDKEATKARILKGMGDAVAMARVACLNVNEDLPEYQRYFEPGHALFVRSIFCAIAGLPLSGCNPLDVGNNRYPVNPLLVNLRVTAGKDFDVTDAMREEETDAVYTGTLFQNMQTTYGVGGRDDYAIIELRKRAFDYPDIADIMDIGKLRNMGTKDSGKMTSLGALLLHELCHWRLLTRTPKNANYFDALLTETINVKNSDGTETQETVDWIRDYKPDEHDDPDIEPDDGYGPQHAIALEVNGKRESFRNADNYRWCAVSCFFKSFMNYQFQGQDDNDQGDKMIPVGANGQVPYPGETLQSRALPASLLQRAVEKLNMILK